MALRVEHAHGRVPVAILEIHGDLDYSNYLEVIETVRAIYAEGGRCLLIDLTDVPYMGSSGLVALHSAALLMAGQEPPDPEGGWSAFHATDQVTDSGFRMNVKLLGPQPRVDQMLQRTALKRFFEVVSDRTEAIGSF